MCKIGSSLWTNASIVLILFHCNVRVVSSIFIIQAGLNIYELYSSCNGRIVEVYGDSVDNTVE